MIDYGKRNLFGVDISALDYDAAVSRVMGCAREKQHCTVTALAVHGLMTGSTDSSHRFRLNSFDLAVPDGQPVRWALNFLYGLDLKDRVYGPNLTIRLCREAAKGGIPVYFYGSRPQVLEQLCRRMIELCPGLMIAGATPSKFRRLTVEERATLIQDIQQSGARIVFVGLGCPRQEVFAYEMGSHLPMPILAVGAAFDYHSGLLRQPPEFIQRAGLQWLYRLMQEPKRLWRRYLVTNAQFIVFLLLQWSRLWDPRQVQSEAPQSEALFG